MILGKVFSPLATPLCFATTMPWLNRVSKYIYYFQRALSLFQKYVSHLFQRPHEFSIMIGSYIISTPGSFSLHSTEVFKCFFFGQNSKKKVFDKRLMPFSGAKRRPAYLAVVVIVDIIKVCIDDVIRTLLEVEW